MILQVYTDRLRVIVISMYVVAVGEAWAVVQIRAPPRAIEQNPHLRLNGDGGICLTSTVRPFCYHCVIVERGRNV